MSKRSCVWIIDDDRSIRWVLEKALLREDIPCMTFSSASDALRELERSQPSAVLSDIRMPGVSGLELLQALRERLPKVPVIVMTAYSDLDSAVAAFQGGAFEYLPKPFDVDQALDLVRRALAENASRDVPASSDAPAPEILGQAPAMQEVFRAIGRLSQSHATVLITGESGSGKELVARALHRHSPRAGGPFIALNTAAIPRDLLESELFGHEMGAFTGATRRHSGRFEQADGGTLFLDEIGDMPLLLQTRLLRVLAEGEFYRVGGRELIRADVRVIAATHQDLEGKVARGEFRADLLHRLDVVRIHLPSLRERREDIALLAEHFLARAADQLKVGAKRWSARALAVVERFDWPGNVRQLENLCRRLAVMAPGREIRAEDLPFAAGVEAPPAAPEWSPALRRWAEQELALGRGELHSRASAELERVLLDVALNACGGHRQQAAQVLGLGRNTLTRKLGSSRGRSR